MKLKWKDHIYFGRECFLYENDNCVFLIIKDLDSCNKQFFYPEIVLKNKLIKGVKRLGAPGKNNFQDAEQELFNLAEKIRKELSKIVECYKQTSESLKI